MTDEALRGLQPKFNKLYAKIERPSIAPEKLLRALLLQAPYSVRSERLLMEQLGCLQPGPPPESGDASDVSQWPASGETAHPSLVLRLDRQAPCHVAGALKTRYHGNDRSGVKVVIWRSGRIQIDLVGLAVRRGIDD